MSPVFLSSLRRPPTPASFESSGSGDAAVSLLRRYSVTTYLPTRESSPIASDDSEDGMSMPSLESISEDEEYGAPPSTQPRPVDQDFRVPDAYPTLQESRPREWSMEQFICFVYRDTAIWLRVTVVMEENARGYATPHVMVRFMTHFNENDPALRRIGLVIERELQEGMRREILSAVRQAVRVRMDNGD